MKKRFGVFAIFTLLGVGISLIPLASQPVVEAEASSSYTNGHIIIPVVRPDFWDDADAVQVLRIAESSEDLDNNTNTTWVYIDDWKADANGWADGGNSKYAGTGVVFYELEYSTISGKYFDLVRYNPDKDTRWNKTASEQFDDGMLHRMWRIWDDGKGIYRPEGATAESRGASNEVVAKVLSGYLTCSSSSINGYGAIKALDDHYNLGRWWGETTVNDFSSVDDYATGKGSGQEVPAYDKYVAMLASYEANQGSRSLNERLNGDNITLIVVIGLIGFTALAGFYFLQKKKSNLNKSSTL